MRFCYILLLFTSCKMGRSQCGNEVDTQGRPSLAVWSELEQRSVMHNFIQVPIIMNILASLFSYTFCKDTFCCDTQLNYHRVPAIIRHIKMCLE